MIGVKDIVGQEALTEPTKPSFCQSLTLASKSSANRNSSLTSVESNLSC